MITPASGEAQEVSPEAAVEILKVTPPEAKAGGEVLLGIEGRNFARGVYVSFLNPAVRILSMVRKSDERLEVRVAIGAEVPSGVLRLYVSNSAGPAAASELVILGGVERSPASLPGPASIADMKSGLVEAKLSPETAPAAVSGSAGETQAPEVASVEPPRVSPGSEVTLEIAGKNFAPGATVAFANPGIRVLKTEVANGKKLIVTVKIAADAPEGSAGLFVVNPDDSEAEFPFAVAKEISEPAASVRPDAKAPGPAAGAALSFEVLNLGEGMDIFQDISKPKGTLSVAGGKVKYEEAGKEVFSAAPEDIRDLGMNTLLGVSTGTFHLTLQSGKSFNFVPASLRTAETPAIVEALHNALK